jgi:hypothetical protein
MKSSWYVIGALLLSFALAPLGRAEDSDMPEEVREDVQRIYPLGEQFDRKHIQQTCSTDQSTNHFRCFRATYETVIKEQEPTVTGYVLLLSIGTVVLAEERQKILDSGRTESEMQGDLQRNTLDTAELLIETLERVGKKAKVITQEKPVAQTLRNTLLSRAGSVLKQRTMGRSIASTSNIPTTGSQTNESRREALLERLQTLTPK